MGGKNPAIVSAKADLDVAAAGIARSVFGFTGQKCSACSRVHHVQQEVYQPFLQRLADQATKAIVGDPTDLSVFMCPVIDGAAVERFERAVAHAREADEVVAGGDVLRGSEGYGSGNYVAPTVVTSLPDGDWLMSTELSVPFVAAEVDGEPVGRSAVTPGAGP